MIAPTVTEESPVCSLLELFQQEILGTVGCSFDPSLKRKWFREDIRISMFSVICTCCKDNVELV